MRRSKGASNTLPPTSGKCIQTWPRSAPWLCKISTKLKKDVRDFVEKYFFDTPERPKSLDISTFLEGEEP
ncbi:hypothetical protein AP3564_15320 [Aeribacillus pallidus]|uniref:Uncharacterized protein n=1 Tax=Aeribacillus pallidus TaxID=33936 RepID=A0A223E819_9BACI|nr:hypothetical protein AP3564_15320 [Aeribacillus pallidus]